MEFEFKWGSQALKLEFKQAPTTLPHPRIQLQQLSLICGPTTTPPLFTLGGQNLISKLVKVYIKAYPLVFKVNAEFNERKFSSTSLLSSCEKISFESPCEKVGVRP